MKEDVHINTILIAVAAIILFASGFVAGVKHMSSPNTDTSVSQDTERNQDKHKETDTVVVEEPGGKKTTTTHVSEDTNTRTDSKKDSRVVITAPPQKNLNVSILAGVNVREPLVPIYGVSVSKQVLGPITIGAFGFSSGIIGVSAGMNF